MRLKKLLLQLYHSQISSSGIFSRTLSGSDQNHSSMEKEAQAIVEALWKWGHFLIGNYFKLITDQRSVVFMFNSNCHGKVKTEKTMQWKLELSTFKCDIIYRPGSDNVTPDALARVCSAIRNLIQSLKDLHITLCHPGVTLLQKFAVFYG